MISRDASKYNKKEIIIILLLINKVNIVQIPNRYQMYTNLQNDHFIATSDVSN